MKQQERQIRVYTFRHDHTGETCVVETTSERKGFQEAARRLHKYGEDNEITLINTVWGDEQPAQQ